MLLSLYLTIDPCDGNPCHNGGECMFDDMAPFTCRCPEGWGGYLCDEPGMISWAKFRHYMALTP